MYHYKKNKKVKKVIKYPTIFGTSVLSLFAEKKRGVCENALSSKQSLQSLLPLLPRHTILKIWDPVSFLLLCWVQSSNYLWMATCLLWICLKMIYNSFAKLARYIVMYLHDPTI